MKRNNILLAALLASSLAANAQVVKINVDAADPGIRYSQIYMAFSLRTSIMLLTADYMPKLSATARLRIVTMLYLHGAHSCLQWSKHNKSACKQEALSNNAQGKALQITVKADRRLQLHRLSTRDSGASMQYKAENIQTITLCKRQL